MACGGRAGVREDGRTCIVEEVGGGGGWQHMHMKLALRCCFVPFQSLDGMDAWCSVSDLVPHAVFALNLTCHII